METVLKPALEQVEIPVDGPGGRYTVPSVELRIEDFPAHVLQMTECFLPLRCHRGEANKSCDLVSGRPASTRRWWNPRDAATSKTALRASNYGRLVDHFHDGVLPICQAAWR